MYTTQDDRPPSVTSECIMSYIARWQRHRRRPKHGLLAVKVGWRDEYILYLQLNSHSLVQQRRGKATVLLRTGRFVLHFGCDLARNSKKWLKNCDDRSHRRGIFHRENLMWHSTASATGQSERWSTACGKIPTSLPSKMSRIVGRPGPCLIHSSLGPPESTSLTASRSVQRFCRADRQTDRLTDRQTILLRQ